MKNNTLYRKGDKVIFLGTNLKLEYEEYDLTVGKVYTIEDDCTIEKTHPQEKRNLSISIWVTSDADEYIGYGSASYNFMSLKEYRRQKISKINENR